MVFEDLASAAEESGIRDGAIVEGMCALHGEVALVPLVKVLGVLLRARPNIEYKLERKD